MARAMRAASEQRKATQPPDAWADVDAEAALGWLRAAGATDADPRPHAPPGQPAGSRPGCMRHVLSDWDLDHARRRAPRCCAGRPRASTRLTPDEAAGADEPRADRALAGSAGATRARSRGARFPTPCGRRRWRASRSWRGAAPPTCSACASCATSSSRARSSPARAASRSPTRWRWRSPRRPACRCSSSGLQGYDGFVGIVVHADEVVARRERHRRGRRRARVRRGALRRGDEGGPVMLSWRDVADGRRRRPNGATTS